MLGNPLTSRPRSTQHTTSIVAKRRFCTKSRSNLAGHTLVEREVLGYCQTRLCSFRGAFAKKHQLAHLYAMNCRPSSLHRAIVTATPIRSCSWTALCVGTGVSGRRCAPALLPGLCKHRIESSFRAGSFDSWRLRDFMSCITRRFVPLENGGLADNRRLFLGIERAGPAFTSKDRLAVVRAAGKA